MNESKIAWINVIAKAITEHFYDNGHRMPDLVKVSPDVYKRARESLHRCCIGPTLIVRCNRLSGVEVAAESLPEEAFQ